MISMKVIGLLSVFIVLIAFYVHDYHYSALFSILTQYTFLSNLKQIFSSVVSTFPLSLTNFNHDINIREILLTTQELEKFDGKEINGKLYLGILGQVFDVTKGKKHYGPGGDYHFFTGRDASRAFVTGDFSTEGLTDDVSNLSPEQLRGLKEWTDFYRKEYTYVGKLLGRYYDIQGYETPYSIQVDELIRKAEHDRKDAADEKRKFPPCNTEWSREKGSRVWCSTRSGGIERSWTGFPRKIYVLGSSKPRCACIKDPRERSSESQDYTLDNPRLEEYPGCPKDSVYRMIRRSPTRIVLKLDDLQDYELMRREQENKKQSIPTQPLQAMKTKQEIIHERIGYVPQQRPT